MFKDRDTKAGIFILILSILGYYYSVVYIYSIGVVGVAPDFYPKLLFLILGICGIALIVQGIRRTEKEQMPKFNFKMLGITLALLVLYSILLEFVGFVISSIVFMVLFMFVLGERKPVLLAAVPVATTLIIYFLFTKAFMIMLP